MALKKIVVQPGQCLMDVALSAGGSVGEFLEHLALMNGLEYTDSLEPGRELVYDPAMVERLDVVNYYGQTLDGEIPATADVDVAAVDPDGVGYDIIEDDLIVYE